MRILLLSSVALLSALPAAAHAGASESAEPFVASRDREAREPLARMPHPGDLLRSAQRIRGRAARGRAGGAEPGAPSFLSEQRLRRRLPGLAPQHRLPVQLHLHGHDRPDRRSPILGPRPPDRRAGAERQRLSPGRPRHPLSHHRDPPLLGAEPGPADRPWRPHLLPHPRQRHRRGVQPGAGRMGARGRTRERPTRSRAPRCCRSSSPGASASRRGGSGSRRRASAMRRPRSAKSRSPSAGWSTAPSAPAPPRSPPPPPSPPRGCRRRARSRRAAVPRVRMEGGIRVIRGNGGRGDTY